jgi:hypothetical protein
VGYCATLLGNQKVLVTGGSNDAPQRTSTELYDPANGTWSPVGDLK